MNKLFVLALIVIVASSVFALHGFQKDPAYDALNVNRKGLERVSNIDERIQNQAYVWQAVAHLEPPVMPILARGFATVFPRGTAKVYSSRYNTDVSAGVQIRVGELLSSYTREYVFEGWLADKETGYWRSLGLFDTIGRGTGELELQKLNNYLDVYDEVVVTREPFPDPSPAPSKEIVLRGDIRKRTPAPYNPNATIQNRLWGVNAVSTD